MNATTPRCLSIVDLSSGLGRRWRNQVSFRGHVRAAERVIGPRQLRFGERGGNNARVKNRKIVQRYLKSSTLLSKFCDYTCVTCVDAASLASLAPQHSSTQSAKLSNHTPSHCHIHHDSSSLAWPRQLGDIPHGAPTNRKFAQAQAQASAWPLPRECFRCFRRLCSLSRG